MLDYDFEIKCIRGEIISADYLNINVIKAIDIFNEDLLQLQKQYEFFVTLNVFTGWFTAL
jgi:hypothetical protein